jgi:hypothetical protein
MTLSLALVAGAEDEFDHHVGSPYSWGGILPPHGEPYQVRADIVDVAYKCSCPSRKLPCKHTLALMLMMVDGALPAARCRTSSRGLADLRVSRRTLSPG